MRSARAVSDAFSEQLRQRSIESRRSTIQLATMPAVGPDLVVSVVEQEFREGAEAGHVRVPVGFALLDPVVRRELVAECLEWTTLELARLRGWDEAAIIEAMATVRAEGLRFQWSGPWKSSPDRRTRVRLEAQLLDNGFSELRLAIEGAGSTKESESVRGWTTMESFGRAAKSLRWASSTVVEFSPGGFESNAFSVDVMDGTVHARELVPQSLEYPGGPVRGALRPRVQPLEPPSLTIGSGHGPTSARTGPYVQRHMVLFEHIQHDPAWLAWWSRVDRKDIWLPVWFNATAAKVIVRLTDKQLSATTFRPTSTIPLDPTEAAELADGDFVRLVARVQAKFQLPARPPLPDR